MIMKNSVVHFEIPADDVQRAISFYTDTFGWKINKFDMPADSSTNGEPYYGVITTDMDEKGRPTTPGAINGGLMKRAHPGHVMANYIDVDSIDDMMKAVIDHGGVQVMAKTEIAPGMGWIAMFKDTEGNMMGLHEMSPEHKKMKDQA